MTADPDPPVHITLQTTDGRTIPADTRYLGIDMTCRKPVWELITAVQLGDVARVLITGRPLEEAPRSALREKSTKHS